MKMKNLFFKKVSRKRFWKKFQRLKVHLNLKPSRRTQRHKPINIVVRKFLQAFKRMNSLQASSWSYMFHKRSFLISNKNVFLRPKSPSHKIEKSKECEASAQRSSSKSHIKINCLLLKKKLMTFVFLLLFLGHMIKNSMFSLSSWLTWACMYSDVCFEHVMESFKSLFRRTNFDGEQFQAQSFLMKFQVFARLEFIVTFIGFSPSLGMCCTI